jgi:primosomal protein N' (replication factor Y) (superfamily II helicase)
MKTKNNKHIIDIIPITRISLTRNQSFSYFYDTKLSPGTLVTIPFSGRKIEGIVVGVRDDFHGLGNIELKKIDKVIEENFLTEKQIELAKFISEYYISPLGIVLKSFVPKRVKARVAKNKNDTVQVRDIEPTMSKKITLTKEQKQAVAEISKNYASNRKTPNKNFLLFGPSGSGKTEVYIHSILELRKKDKDLQFLILVPEKTLTPQALERYGQYFPTEEIVLISSNINAGLFYQNWKKIQSGEVKIVIATRKGVFSPFRKLGLIVVDEEHDISHKQWDMNPRYDARTVAEELGRLHNCPIMRGSATPSVESYYKAENKEVKLLKLPVLKLDEQVRVCLPVRQAGNPNRIINKLNKIADHSANSKLFETSCKPAPEESELPIANCQLPIIEIVDMRKERWKKNYSCISKKLKNEIEYALRNKQQTILFINRQGMSSFSVCDSCKTVLRCPKCERALAYDNSGIYYCLHCNYKTSITPGCEKCHGIVFKNIGLGTQKVEREINNLFSRARIARIDSQAIREKDYAEKIYRDFSDGKIDILIGTQMISKGWDLPNVSLIGIIDTDNMLSLPDFRTNESFFQNLSQVFGRTGRPGAKYPGIIIVQTFQPENRHIKAVCERNYQNFFETEIEERQVLSYPPHGKIIKLVFQDYFPKRIATETERIYQALKSIPDIHVTEPQDAFISNIRGRHRRQIIIKFKEKVPEKLITELKKLSSGWIIDVDPISTI